MGCSTCHIKAPSLVNFAEPSDMLQFCNAFKAKGAYMLLSRFQECLAVSFGCYHCYSHCSCGADQYAAGLHCCVTDPDYNSYPDLPATAAASCKSGQCAITVQHCTPDVYPHNTMYRNKSMGQTYLIIHSCCTRPKAFHSQQCVPGGS